MLRLGVAKIEEKNNNNKKKTNKKTPGFSTNRPASLPPVHLGEVVKTFLTYSVMIGRADSDWQELPWQRHNDTQKTNRKAKQNVSALHSLWI